jgi:hypothetical protein
MVSNRKRVDIARSKKQRLRSLFFVVGSIVLLCVRLVPAATMQGTTTTARSQQQHSVLNANISSPSCQRAMDPMDGMFNKRRQVRQDAIVRSSSTTA